MFIATVFSSYVASSVQIIPTDDIILVFRALDMWNAYIKCVKSNFIKYHRVTYFRGYISWMFAEAQNIYPQNVWSTTLIDYHLFILENLSTKCSAWNKVLTILEILYHYKKLSYRIFYVQGVYMAIFKHKHNVMYLYNHVYSYWLCTFNNSIIL